MRIVMHAGLHKTGTTSIQANWKAAFGTPGRVWYPSRPGKGAPGHHREVRPMLDAWVNMRDIDLVRTRTSGGVGGGVTLVDRIAQAEQHGTEVLLISAETLDRLQPVDAQAFNDALRGHQTTFLLTVTRPILRWSSGWQELLKHGLAEYPRDAAGHVLKFTGLVPGRVAELMHLLDVDHRLVRVVRTSPHEESLARDIIESLGLAWPEEASAPISRNVSLGTNAEVMRRLNAADQIVGARPGGYRRLRQVLKTATGIREDPNLAEHYRTPEDLAVAAEEEWSFLTEAKGIEVLDPHGQLDLWRDLTPPAWYDEISRAETVIPELEDLPDPSELLWRVRQERAALRSKLEQAQKRIEDLKGQLPTENS